MDCPNCGRALGPDEVTSEVHRGGDIQLIIDCPCGAMIYAEILEADGKLKGPMIHHYRVVYHKEDFENRPNDEKTFQIQKGSTWSENVPYANVADKLPEVEGLRIGQNIRGYFPGTTERYSISRLTNAKPKLMDRIGRKLR